MIEIKVCIGSSCFLKKAPEIVEFLSKKIESENLSDKILLSGSFCAGKCNRRSAYNAYSFCFPSGAGYVRSTLCKGENKEQ